MGGAGLGTLSVSTLHHPGPHPALVPLEAALCGCHSRPHLWVENGAAWWGRWLIHWAPYCPQADLSSLAEIENALVVFCMATYGEGDPTDNAQDFYDWLQEADADLSGVKYAVSLLSPPNPRAK